MNEPVSGAYALARGAIEAGVSLVTGYPGAPTTAVVTKILALTSPDEVQVEWTSNEKVAIEMAFGASLGGSRSLLCVKSVGLNIALDPLMALNLSGCNAGFVILVGDDLAAGARRTRGNPCEGLATACGATASLSSHLYRNGSAWLWSKWRLIRAAEGHSFSGRTSG